jgi:hypothetical protein
MTGMKKYVAPGSEISVDLVTLLNFTPTSVAAVVCGVQPDARNRRAAAVIVQMRFIAVS